MATKQEYEDRLLLRTSRVIEEFPDGNSVSQLDNTFGLIEEIATILAEQDARIAALGAELDAKKASAT